MHAPQFLRQVQPLRARLLRSLSLQYVFYTLGLVLAMVLRLHWLTLFISIPLLIVMCIQFAPAVWTALVGAGTHGPPPRILPALAFVTLLIALPITIGWLDPVFTLYLAKDWDAIGAIGEGVIGAFGQILLALVALIIAWRQVAVDVRLTSRSNTITQAQTIDGFIQGISDLIVDDEGLLEDWPMERMLLEGRLAAVLGSVDNVGKARLLRFVSQARLLTPLRRDSRLGRAILDGQGNYEIDRLNGTAVIQLRRMLRGIDLSGTDLRETDFNGADLRDADMSFCDLRDANFSGCDLTGVDMSRSLLDGTVFHMGSDQDATPCSSHTPPDCESGLSTGAVVENLNLSGAKQLSASSFIYIAAWGGVRTRRRMPGKTSHIPDKLKGALLKTSRTN